MRNVARIAGRALAAVLVVLSAGTAEAQGVSAEDNSQFIGRWTLAFEIPAMPGGGGFAGAGRGGAAGGARAGARARGPQTLEISDRDGRLVAQYSGGIGGPQTISSIIRSGESLVLSYALSAQGQSIPVSIKLIPADDRMNSAMEFAGGQFALSGSATRE